MQPLARRFQALAFLLVSFLARPALASAPVVPPPAPDPGPAPEPDPQPEPALATPRGGELRFNDPIIAQAYLGALALAITVNADGSTSIFIPVGSPVGPAILMVTTPDGQVGYFNLDIT
jgi:hypothetical protein